jgi:hypothetical protein
MNKTLKIFQQVFRQLSPDVLLEKSKRAIIETRKKYPDLKTFAIVGGVGRKSKNSFRFIVSL